MTDSSNIISDEDLVYPSNTVTANVRDERGLLKKINYVFNPDGTVNWRAMVRPTDLYFNKQKAVEIAKKHGIEAAKVQFAKVADFDQSTIDDNHVLISLAGIRYLMRLRGYREVRARLVSSNPDFASVENHITWIGNFETDFREETSADGADAGPHNTFDFAQSYLTAIAFNRALVRNTRGYLNIKIVGNDEIGPNNPRVFKQQAQEEKSAVSLAHSPLKLVTQYYDKLSIQYKWKTIKTFAEQLMIGFVNTKKYTFESDPLTWTQLKDIPHNDLCVLLQIFEKEM